MTKSTAIFKWQSAFSLPVIASEQSERGNPQRKGNAKIMDCHAIFTKTAHNDKRKKPKKQSI